MNRFTFLIPAILLFFCTSLFCLLVLEQDRERKPLSDTERPLHRWLGWILAFVYLPVAFAGLGDANEPESWCVSEPFRCAEFTLDEGCELASVTYFSGINTGEWVLEGSEDGVIWSEQLVLSQQYTDVLRWNSARAEEPLSGPFFRLTADAPGLDMAELGLLDAEGEILRPVTISEMALPLFDEPKELRTTATYLNGSYFDEIYHVRTAVESWRYDGMYEITHPPLGKLILSVGILLFGTNPFGWRFMGTLCGALMLPLLYDLLRRMFRRGSVSAACTVIFALDFMHFTQTRLATIDTYSVLFILGMYDFMFRYLSEKEHKSRNLALSGLFFGLGAASKWTCLYAGAGLGLIWLLNWVQRRALFTRAFWKNVGECLVWFVAIPLAIYYLSYYPYGRTAGLQGAGMFFTRDYFRVVWNNQLYMWRYHSGLVATHPYSSQWWQWVLDIRPILYYASYSAEEKSIIAAFTSPLICWLGLLSLGLCGLDAWRKKDDGAWFILLGYLAQMLPWMAVERLTFAYHYFPSEIFLVLAIGHTLKRLEDKLGNRWWTLAAAGMQTALFALFYPVLSGAWMNRDFCAGWLQWFPSWPF